ncbi:uncharacterized protein [Venturia canescens]|uniref:uncharacterized protein isoform X2 n=1 Tax=Venturia canescens TaxID=32260 RepID=UPI001C9BD7D4|nr:uncharacterized protein LOC122414918 isoform X2 [Venturia canescens]
MRFDGRVECSNHNTVWHARAQQFFVSQKNITALCLKCGTVPFEWKTANAGSKFWNTAVEEFLANITYNPCCECDKTPTEEMFRGQILKDKTSPEKSRQRITKNKVYCDMRVKSAVIELQEMFHIHGWD